MHSDNCHQKIVYDHTSTLPSSPTQSPPTPSRHCHTRLIRVFSSTFRPFLFCNNAIQMYLESNAFSLPPHQIRCPTVQQQSLVTPLYSSVLQGVDSKIRSASRPQATYSSMPQTFGYNQTDVVHSASSH